MSDQNTLSPGKEELLKQALKNIGVGERGQDLIPRRTETGLVRLTHAQERLWFIQQLLPQSNAYNMSYQVTINQELDAQVLDDSIHDLINRHEILRTIFIQQVDIPYQKILPSLPFEVEHHDLSSSSPEEQTKNASSIALKLAQEPFSLKNGPLLRTAIVKLDDAKFLLQVVLHHIIFDIASVSIFFEDLFALYQARVTSSNKVTPLTIQYGDYAQWQKQQQSSQSYASAMEYWENQLANVSPPALISPKQNSSNINAFKTVAKVKSTSLDNNLLERAKAIMSEQGASFFMLALAGFQAFLHRHSETNDIVVASPVLNRTNEQLDELIGFFVNLLLLRTDFTHVENFNQLIASVKQTCIEGFSHQECALDEIIERLGLSQVSQALTRVIFTASQEQRTESPLQISEFSELRRMPKCDLAVDIKATETEIVISFEYNDALFEDSLIEQLLQNFGQFLTSVLQTPTNNINQVSLLTDDEQAHLLALSTGDDLATYDGDVCLRFEQSADKFPEKVAVVDQQESLQFQELDNKANQLAHMLYDNGVKPGDLIAIALPRGCNFLLSILAVHKAGAAFLPLDISHPKNRLATIVKESKPSLIITLGDDEQAFTDDSVPALNFSTMEINDKPTNKPEINRQPDDVAYVIYTSGSTGKPKGVEISHRSVANLIQWYHTALDVNSDAIGTQLAGASFDGAIPEWFGYITAGGCVKVVQDDLKSAAKDLIHYLRAEEITHTFIPTAVFEQTLLEEWPNNMALKHVYTGGDVLHRYPDQDYPFTIHNMYGPTEGTVIASGIELHQNTDKQTRPSIGQPIDGVSVFVLDRQMQVRPLCYEGDIYLGGDNLAKGYRFDEELTAQRFVTGTFSDGRQERLYKTGDRGYYNDAGELIFVQRSDQQISIRGQRVEISEIETHLLNMDSIKIAAVTCFQNQLGENQLAAFVESINHTTLQDVQDYLKQSLPSFMIPMVLYVVPEMPLNSSGKVDYSRLPEIDLEALQDKQNVPPRTDLEQLIANIWGDILQKDNIGIYDNFFALGGHSLLATQIVSRISQQFDKELPVQCIFDEPTIHGLAYGIENHRWDDNRFVPPIVAKQTDTEDFQGQYQQSFSQQRMWFIEQLTPNTSTYSVPLVFKLTGDLNVKALERSINALVQRHSILRSRFDIDETAEETSGFVQLVDEFKGQTLDVSNLEVLSEDEREANCRQLLEEELSTPFNLTEGPVFRTNLVKISQDTHVLCFNMHHMVTDGWSVGIMLNELSHLYRAFSQNHEPSLPELTIQYSDFAEWQTEWLQFGVLEELLYYWQQKLENPPPLLQLANQKQIENQDEHQGNTLSLEFPETLTQQLKATAKANNATLFMVLLAGFKSLLAKHSGQHDIVVGTPIANRHRVELEPLIGLFVNTLVMRTDLNEDPNFSTILNRVKRTALEAYDHQDLPYERLVEQLSPEERWQRAPLFNVVFVMQNFNSDPFELDQLKVEAEQTHNNTAKFDLSLAMAEVDDKIVATFEYSTSLFEEDTIKVLGEHFESLLTHACEAPETPLSQLEILTHEEKAQIVALGQGDNVDPKDLEHPVCHRICDVAKQYPTQIAVAFGDEVLNYQTLNESTNQLANLLQQKGVGKGDVIAVRMARTPLMIMSYIAINKAGATFMPLDSANPVARIDTILQESKASLLLGQADNIAEVADLSIDIIAVDSEDLSVFDSSDVSLDISPNDCAYIIYTSGSTGTPKGIEVSHSALANMATWQARKFNVNSQSRATQVAGTGFDASMFEIWCYLISGASVTIVEDDIRYSATDLIEFISAQEITHAFMPTPMIEQCISLPWPETCQLSYLFAGGDALTKRPANNASYKLFNIYGPAENAVASSWAEILPHGQDNRVPPIGYPIDGVNLYIMDEHQNIVPKGVAGEIYIGGQSLASKYRNNPLLTSERFLQCSILDDNVERLYRTGDVARFLPDGQLAFLGRSDDQIKLRGYRIELGEIKAQILSHGGCSDVYMLAKEGKDDSKNILAYIVPHKLELISDDEASSKERASIQAHIRQSLPDYMLPHKIIFLTELPKQINGKVDRNALPESNERQDYRTTEIIAPNTSTEKQLSSLWSHYLEYSPVSIDDHFFESGGHSLLALKFQVEIRSLFNVDLPLNEFFNNATLENLAARIDLLKDDTSTKQVPQLNQHSMTSSLPANDEVGLVGKLKNLFGSKTASDDQQIVRKSQLKLTKHQINDLLVKIKDGNEEQPLFVIHPVGGGVMCYSEIAQYMNSEHAIYGLKSIDDESLKELSIEELASLYVDVMLATKPTEAYRIAGWSIGGVIAYEIASQLKQLGKNVNTLVLVDSYPFEGTQSSDYLPENALLESFVIEQINQFGRMGDLLANGELQQELSSAKTSVTEQQLPQVRDILVNHHILPEEIGEDLFQSYWESYRANYEAWSCYEPTPYTGKVHLILASESVQNKSPVQVWGKHVSGGISISVISTDHHKILTGDAANLAAEKLDSLLA